MTLNTKLQVSVSLSQEAWSLQFYIIIVESPEASKELIGKGHHLLENSLELLWLKKIWECCARSSQYEIQIKKKKILGLEWKQDTLPNLPFQVLALRPGRFRPSPHPCAADLSSLSPQRQPWELRLARSMKTSTLPDVSAPFQAHQGARGSGMQPDHLSLGTALNCCANEQGLNWKHEMHIQI